jgi:serine/threonine-protein kinase
VNARVPSGSEDRERRRPSGERVTEIGDFERIDPRPHPWAAGVGLTFVIAVYVFGAVALGLAVRESDRRVDIPDVEVPAISGLSEDGARERLEEVGLIMVVQEASNEVVPAGAVYDQEPLPGAKIELGSPVTGLVSTGPAGIVVPDTVAQQVTEAAALLRTLGLSAQQTPVYDELIRPGEVLYSTPAAGERVPTGGTVELAVSGGPAPRTVPALVDTTGQPRTALDVLAELGRLGLRPASIDEVVDASRPLGTVVSIDPGSGTQVPRGTEVSMAVVVAEDGAASVPWVEGLQESTAVSAMEAAGLVPRLRRVDLPVGDPASGRVVRQGVPGGSEVPAGQPVEVVVGVALPPPTTTTTAPPSTTSTTTAPR